MILSDLASVFMAEVWAIVKHLEQITNASSSNYIVFTDSLSCLQTLQHMKLEHPLIWDGDTKMCLFNLYEHEDYFILGTHP